MSPNLKHAAAIATALAAIVASIVGLVKDRPEPRAEASYTVLAKKVEELQKQQAQSHDDLVALRAYLDGYLQKVRLSQQKASEIPKRMEPPRVGPVPVIPVPPKPALPAPRAKANFEPPPAFQEAL